MTDDRAHRLAIDRVAESAGLRFSESQRQTFCLYLDLILKWNVRIGLTAHRSATEIITVDFADAFAVLAAGIPQGSRLLDVGSGAGFPGIPLRIARPDLDVILLDANRRKVSFLEHAINVLGVAARVECERAETAGHQPQLREAFDVAVTRAVAPLAVVVELTLPFVHPGGKGIFLKGPRVVSEQLAGARAARVLGGGELEFLHSSTTSSRKGVIVVVPKVDPTPERFPRRPGTPQRTPLR